MSVNLIIPRRHLGGPHLELSAKKSTIEILNMHLIDTAQNEQTHEKTCLQGFQPGPTLTFNQAVQPQKRLEILDFFLQSRGIALSM